MNKGPPGQGNGANLAPRPVTFAAKPGRILSSRTHPGGGYYRAAVLLMATKRLPVRSRDRGRF